MASFGFSRPTLHAVRRLERHWAPSLDAPARRDQRGGRFRAYQPDELRNHRWFWMRSSRRGPPRSSGRCANSRWDRIRRIWRASPGSLLDLSFPPARAAVEELANAGIVARRRVDRGTTGYLATEVFDLLMYAERSELVRSP